LAHNKTDHQVLKPYILAGMCINKHTIWLITAKTRNGHDLYMCLLYGSTP